MLLVQRWLADYSRCWLLAGWKRTSWYPVWISSCSCTKNRISIFVDRDMGEALPAAVTITVPQYNIIPFITIPEMHHAVATSFSLLTTDRINLRTKRHRKCHQPEPVGIFYTVWYVNLFDQYQVAKKRNGNYFRWVLMVIWRIRIMSDRKKKQRPAHSIIITCYSHVLCAIIYKSSANDARQILFIKHGICH